MVKKIVCHYATFGLAMSLNLACLDACVRREGLFFHMRIFKLI